MIMQLDLTEKKHATAEDVNVDYTKRIVEALKAKAKEHNEANEHKVTFNQLKSVFVVGASERIDTFPLLLSGFARVNMYLRLLDPSVVVYEFKEAADNKKFKKLIFDFSSHIVPKSDDYRVAQDDLAKFKLDFDFNSVEELYLSETASAPSWLEYL
jgi:hypothetical protein